MNVKLKYITICTNIILMHVSTNIGHVISESKDIFTSGNVRTKRQAGYVYDKPTVSFDLPTVPVAPSIATTQAPTVDRTQMQMYYAYPVPASGAGNTVQSTGYSTGSASAGTSGASGYNYGVQNSGSSSGSTSAGSGASGYNYDASDTGSSPGSGATGPSGASGYNYGVQNTQVTDTRTTLTETQNTGGSGYQNTAAVRTQAVVSTGSTGYGSGRPTSVSTSGGSVSTSAPRYLPPTTSGENTGGVSVTTSNQASTGSTITRPSESYIPPSVQISSPQNEKPPESYIPPSVQVSSPQIDQTVTITQSGANTASSSGSSSPNTGYLQPSVSPQPRPVQTAPSVPTQQYLPPNESPATVERPLTAPAATYLPPVF